MLLKIKKISNICPGPYNPNCNIFDHNCVGCDYVYNNTNACSVNVYCSCHYCCEPTYAAESCPNGCRECVKDGEGGCPENSANMPSWFDEIDHDGNNQIEPGEFDRSLIEVRNNQTSGCTAGKFVGSDGGLYPCVSLFTFVDEIEANFGPKFKYDIADGI
uniref:EF-hand domain-containing protein n=1 Tax=Globodera rostochiensis TaxID=31243 RepID=A0A914I3T9_GLORO